MEIRHVRNSTLLAALAVASLGLASEPTPVGRWVGKVKYPKSAYGNSWKEDIMRETEEEGKVLLTVRSNGAFTMTSMEPRTGTPMTEVLGRWARRRGGLTISLRSETKRSTLYLSKDGRRLSFTLAAGAHIWSRNGTYRFVRSAGTQSPKK